MSTTEQQTIEPIAASIEKYASLLFELFEEDESNSIHSVTLELQRIKSEPFFVGEAEALLNKLKKTHPDVSAYELTKLFSEKYPEIVQGKKTRSTSSSLVKEDDKYRDLWYQFSTLCTFMMPHAATQDTEVTLSYPGQTLQISSPDGLPYGSVARTIILYVNSVAVKFRTRQIPLGKTISEFVRMLGYTPSFKEGDINDQVMEQLNRLFKSTFYLEQTIVEGEADQKIRSVGKKRFNFFDASLDVSEVFAKGRGETTAALFLSSQYYEQIVNHPVPLSVDVIKSLKKSPMALDLYCFTTYRANTRRMNVMKLESLKAQFGFNGPTWRFKQQLDRGLTKLHKALGKEVANIKDDNLVIPCAALANKSKKK